MDLEELKCAFYLNPDNIFGVLLNVTGMVACSAWVHSDCLLLERRFGSSGKCPRNHSQDYLKRASDQHLCPLFTKTKFVNCVHSAVNVFKRFLCITCANILNFTRSRVFWYTESFAVPGSLASTLAMAFAQKVLLVGGALAVKLISYGIRGLNSSCLISRVN